MEVSIKLRKATIEDLTRIRPSDDRRVWIDGKDLWAIGVKGDLQYYRMNIRHPMIPSMVKELLPTGRILVVDVEGVERDWSAEKENESDENND